MVASSRPSRKENEPCSVCGSQVRVETYRDRRKFGEPEGRLIEKRVCTSSDCPTNDTRDRKTGQTP